MASSRPKVGIVLSGGGSRGAYETGIILYLRDRLAKRLGFHVPIDIVTGTSVGAINGAFMAATMEQPETQGQRMVEAWRSLRIEELLSFHPKDLWNGAKMLLGRDLPPPPPGSYRHGGLLNTTGLERFVLRAIPWRRIEQNVRSGAFESLSVSATHVGTGHTIVFIDSGKPIPAGWSKDPFVRHRAARIGPRHVLASAAIPMLFPAVKIGTSFFTDGGLRQNTPMSPALRLGADRVIVISLRHVGAVATPEAQKEREEAYPKPMFLMGKALNALMLDHTEYDLDRMQRLNALLTAGEAAYGAGFHAVLNAELIKLRGAPVRKIEAVHIRPSADIGRIAAQFVAEGRADVRGRVAKGILGKLGSGESAHESDLLSYLLFDGQYASELIDLGYEDARAQEDDLAAFFEPCRPA